MSDLDLDAVSIKVLNAAYKDDLHEAEYNELIHRRNCSEPNEVDQFLRRENLIQRKTICAISDGEGGFSRVHYMYVITRRGRAVVEQQRLGWFASLVKAILSLLSP